jgi:hypothetical protein
VTETLTDLDPTSQDQVERRIVALSDQLSAITDDVMHANETAAKADARWRLEKAKTKLRYEFARAQVRRELKGHSGTEAEKEAQVLQYCEKEYTAMVLAEHGELYEDKKAAEAVANSIREKGENVRASLSGLQTIARNIRTAIDYSHGRGG